MASSRRWTKFFAASLLTTTLITMNANAASTVRATANVNVRKGPGSSYSVVATLNKGDKATRLGSSDDWIKIQTDSYKGYVYEDYLTTVSSSKTRYCTASSLNVRKKASTSSSVIGSLSYGERCQVVSTTNGWSKIKYNGSYGYVSSDYLSKNKPSGSSSNTSQVKTRYCTASSLNIRKKATTSSSVIGSLSYGKSCKVVSTSNGWSKIKYNGSYGYVSSKYLSKTKPSGSSSGNSSTKTRYCTASSLNVRRRASTSSDIIGSLSYGESCKVISTSNHWSKIKYNSSTGYVSSDYLSKNKPSNTSSVGKRIISVAKSLLDCKYEYGAAGPKKFDCSGFTQYVYKQCGISIPRTSADQYRSRTHVKKSDLRAGDLVFFDTNDSGGVSHVAIYLEDGRIIHSANSKDDVCIDTMSSGYYKKRYLGAGRYR